MASVFISCGEPSGDLYASALVEHLRSLDPDVRVTGFGGDRLKAAGASLLGDYRGLTVTGLVEAVRVLPRSLEMYRRLVRAAPVSYTHLRAHETRHDLVCRLLLEKK